MYKFLLLHYPTENYVLVIILFTSEHKNMLFDIIREERENKTT
jgi:hypothetical protein